MEACINQKETIQAQLKFAEFETKIVIFCHYTRRFKWQKNKQKKKQTSKTHIGKNIEYLDEIYTSHLCNQVISMHFFFIGSFFQ